MVADLAAAAEEEEERAGDDQGEGPAVRSQAAQVCIFTQRTKP